MMKQFVLIGALIGAMAGATVAQAHTVKPQTPAPFDTSVFEGD